MAYLGNRLSHGVAEDPMNIVVEVSETRADAERIARAELKAKRRAFREKVYSKVGETIGVAANAAKNKIVPQPVKMVEVERVVEVEKPVMVETIREVHVPLVIEKDESSFFGDTVPDSWTAEVKNEAQQD